MLNEGDPEIGNELVALREAINETIDHYQLSALTQAYAAIARNLKEGDLRAAQEVKAIRVAIKSTIERSTLAALAQVYSAIAKAGSQAILPEEDLAILLGQFGRLRSIEETQAFAAAIKQILRFGTPRISWQKAGLVTTALLLQPVSASEQTTRQLVDDYETIIGEHPSAPRPNKRWSGDVWLFVEWARIYLPGFSLTELVFEQIGVPAQVKRLAKHIGHGFRRSAPRYRSA
jgi:hypothetical protein